MSQKCVKRRPQNAAFRPFLASRIIRGAMIDKAHLRDKQVAFRLVGSTRVHIGIVRLVESDGFWIESPHLQGELQQDAVWAPAIATIQSPVLFVPTSSLMFLIAPNE